MHDITHYVDAYSVGTEVNRKWLWIVFEINISKNENIAFTWNVSILLLYLHFAFTFILLTDCTLRIYIKEWIVSSSAIRGDGNTKRPKIW